MFHQPEKGGAVSLQQVELNTVSAAFASLATTTSNMHRYHGSIYIDHPNHHHHHHHASHHRLY
jgi:hypothetical protein